MASLRLRADRPRPFAPWVAAALLVLLALWRAWKVANSRTFQFFGNLVAELPCSEPLVALTLDDGPTTEGTPPLLELLAQHDVHATFFLVGRELFARCPVPRE